MHRRRQCRSHLGLTDEGEIAEIAAMKRTEQTKVHEQMNEDEKLPPVTKEALILCGFDNQKTVNLLPEQYPPGPPEERTPQGHVDAEQHFLDYRNDFAGIVERTRIFS